jgi:hypothetical protein
VCCNSELVDLSSMRSAASRLSSVLRAGRAAGSRSFAAEAAPAVSSDIGYVAQVNAASSAAALLMLPSRGRPLSRVLKLLLVGYLTL